MIDDRIGIIIDISLAPALLDRRLVHAHMVLNIQLLFGSFVAHDAYLVLNHCCDVQFARRQIIHVIFDVVFGAVGLRLAQKLLFGAILAISVLEVFLQVAHCQLIDQFFILRF